MLRRLRHHVAIFFAVIGPGFITAMVDNDAGGIYTYSAAGAQFGYMPLWTLLPIMFALIVTQEMCSRMGAVTGKGLSDLIREEFGFRTTFFVMIILVLVNLTNLMSDFAGIATSLELFGISPFLSVPLGAAAIWVLVVKGTYRTVEKAFLLACVFYVAYIFSAFLVRPNWTQAAVNSFLPHLLVDNAYVFMLVGMVGTSVAPWMQFYLQSAVVEKGIDEKQYRESRVEVIVGCVVMTMIAFFIVVACAGAIYSHGPREIRTAAEAAEGLRPFGRYAYLLFSAGLFNASLFAASILPLSTAYSVCEGLGFESGVNKGFKDAPVFYWLYTLMIVVGAGVVLLPRFPLVRMILFSQVLNGVLLPVILIFMLLLVNRKDLMGDWTNSRMFNGIAWTTTAVMIFLSLSLAALSWRG
jgi:NRAMP (natural resistance-associated macrophage protein)-like metal ion transporter